MKILENTLHFSDIDIQFKKKFSKNDHAFKIYLIKKILSSRKKEIKISEKSIDKILKFQHGENFFLFLKKFCEKNCEIIYKKDNNKRYVLYFSIIDSYLKDGTNYLLTIGNEFYNIFCNEDYYLKKLNLDILLTFSSPANRELYIFLKNSSYQGDITIEVEKLKLILGVTEGYERFYDLEKNILIPALKDIKVFFDDKINYSKLKSSNYVNGKITKIKFEFSNNDNLKIMKILQQSKSLSKDFELIEKEVEKISRTHDYSYIKKNFIYSKLHFRENFDDFFISALKHNYSDFYFKNQMEKYKKEYTLLYEKSAFYQDIESFRNEILKKIKSHKIDNITFIFNVVKISLDVFSQIYKNKEILKNPVYASFYYDLEKYGNCLFENEKYLIIAEYNSTYFESKFVIFKK